MIQPQDLQKPYIAKGSEFYRIGHPRDDAGSNEAQQAVNLGQGFPDFATPEDIKQKAIEAIAADHNQYAITWGVKSFRDAISAKTQWFLGMDIDPETEITVTCGSTEGMIAAMMATVDPGEEVVVFEPFYENYAPDAILSDATPRHVPLYGSENGFIFDRDELRAAFNEKTKAIIICNPNNPTGKVFYARRARIHCRSLQRIRCIGVYGRDLRTHYL